METTEPGVPGIIAAPPVLYLGAFGGAGLLNLMLPLPLTATGFAVRLLGGIVLLANALFARWAFVTMRQLGTSASPRKASEKLTTSGPFALSRNPIYLAMTGLYLGATGVLNSWWPLPLLVPLLWLMHWGVILREERYLVARFGEAYTAYMQTVPRWI